MLTKPKKNLRGFTLVEIFLGLGLFSIIALSLYGTLNSAIQLDRRSQDVNGIYREARWSLDRMAKDLEQMQPYNFGNSYPDLKAFSGTADKITFLSSTGAGLKMISYYLQLPESGTVHKVVVGNHSTGNRSIVAHYEEKFVLYSLVREEKAFADYLTSDPQAKAEKDVLSPNVQQGSLEFSYAYIEGPEENSKIVWKGVWDKSYIPSGVRIKLTFIRPGKIKQPVVLQRDVYIVTGFLGQENL